MNSRAAGRPIAMTWVAIVAAASVNAAVPGGAGVIVQTIPAPLRINGLSVELAQLSGPGLELLLQRTRRQWGKASAAADILQVGGWQVLSRQTETDSEVLQWRGEGGAQRALYSRLDRQQPRSAMPAFVWRLPEACRWQQTLDSLQSQVRTLQGTAQCNGRVASVLRQLRTSLETDKWLLSGDGAHYPLVWRKANVQLQVVLTEARAVSHSATVALVAVQTSDAVQP